MASNTSQRPTPSKQARTDNSEPQPGKADVSWRHSDREQSRQPPRFYFEQDSSSRDDFSATGEPEDDTSGSFHTSSPAEEDAVLVPPCDSRTRKSAPRPVPGVHRADSSPLSAVCRPCHSHLVVRCQVNCHHLPHLSSSCPAAFSPAWTWVLPPVSPSKDRSATSAGTAKEKRRRHTVGPANQAEQLRLRQLQQQHRGSEGSLLSPWPSLDGRGRSMSDSELQQLLMREVGRELRRMSDQLNVSRTGQQLTTVTESEGSSEDDSDDEM